MSKAVRVGDVNSAGGVVVQGHPTVLINGRPAARMFSAVTPHPCCPKKRCFMHCAAVVVGPGEPTVIVSGLPMMKTGDIDSCGHARVSGSTNVRV